MAAVQIFCGRRDIRLFPERFDGVQLVLAFGAVAAVDALDIPQRRAGKCRPDTESHHVIRIAVDIGQPVSQCRLERLVRLDDLIGGDHGDRCLGVIFRQDRGGQSDRPGGIPHGRFRDDIVGGKLRKVFADHVGIAGVR